MRGSSTSMTGQVAPVQPLGQPRGGDRGDRRGIGDHEPDPRRRQRRVDRQIRRPGLEHRQNRHDRLSGPGKQQRHTLHPGPHRIQPASAPTGSTPHRARGTSTNAPRTPAPPPPGRGPPARRTTPEPTPPRRRLGQHRPVTRSHPAAACSPASSTSTDDNDRPGSAVIATNTRCNRPAKSETSKFENGCPAPAVLRKSWSPTLEKINPKPPHEARIGI